MKVNLMLSNIKRTNNQIDKVIYNFYLGSLIKNNIYIN